MMYLIFILLAISITINAYLFWQRSKPKKQLTEDAKDLLHFIMQGQAIVRIEVLDPEQILMYRGGK